MDPSDPAATPDPGKPRLPIFDYSVPDLEMSCVRLRGFSSTMEAELARAALGAEGIPAQVTGQALLAGLGDYGPIANGLEVLVRESDVEAAGAILDRIEANRARRRAAEEGRLRCPRCGGSKCLSGDPKRTRAALICLAVGFVECIVIVNFAGEALQPFAVCMAVALGIVGLFIFVSVQGRRVCQECQFAWTRAEDDDPGEDSDESDE